MGRQLLGLAFGVMISSAIFLGLWQPWEDDAIPVAAVPTQTAAEARNALCERHLDRISGTSDRFTIFYLVAAAERDGCAR